MSRRKNAGEGYGMQFHGAFGLKSDAKKKERQVHGFIQPRNIRGERRYVVMSERKNPIKRRKNLFGLFEHKKRSTGPQPGDVVKVRFKYRGETEAIWVKVTGKSGSKFRGELVNDPVVIPKQYGDTVSFSRSQLTGERHNNPSELLVLGANPHGNRDLNLPAGSTITIRVNPTVVGPPVKRRNPSAEAIREDFTGAPADGYTVHNVEGMPGGEYAQLGELLSLYVKPLIGGQVREIRFMVPRPLLVSDTSARQLYFVGGDQDISEGLNLFNSVIQYSGLVELGEVRRIDYKQRKAHVKDPDIDEWKHQFGEESGVKPTLWFDRHARQLFLKGGEYQVRREGIVN